MKIFNRWGALVFEINDINNGWNGTYNGEPVSAAIYVYSIRLTTKNNSVIKTGTINLIR